MPAQPFQPLVQPGPQVPLAPQVQGTVQAPAFPQAPVAPQAPVGPGTAQPVQPPAPLAPRPVAARPRSPSRGRRRHRSPSPAEYSSDEDFGSEESWQEPEDEVEDETSLSYRERLRLVYQLLGDKLPQLPQAHHQVRSVVDEPRPQSPSSLLPESLPWSPGVSSAFSSLQSFLQPSSDPSSARRRGHKAQRRAAGKFLSLPEAGVSGRAYKFTEEGLPLSAPLPEDGLADLCDTSFSAAPEVRLPYKAAVDLEEGLRRLAGVSSHADWLSAAAIKVARLQEGDSSSLVALLQSWNRANSDIMQLASWAVANLLLARRDAFSRAFSRDLPSDRRTWLRCQPLTSSLLFGGRVDEARELIRANRRDRAFTSVLSSQTSAEKPLFPSSASRKRKRASSSTGRQGSQWRGSGSAKRGGRDSSRSRRGGGGAGGKAATSSRGGKSSTA